MLIMLSYTDFILLPKRKRNTKKLSNNTTMTLLQHSSCLCYLIYNNFISRLKSNTDCIWAVHTIHHTALISEFSNVDKQMAISQMTIWSQIVLTMINLDLTADYSLIAIFLCFVLEMFKVNLASPRAQSVIYRHWAKAPLAVSITMLYCRWRHKCQQQITILLPGLIWLQPLEKQWKSEFLRNSWPLPLLPRYHGKTSNSDISNLLLLPHLYTIKPIKPLEKYSFNEHVRHLCFWYVLKYLLSSTSKYNGCCSRGFGSNTFI